MRLWVLVSMVLLLLSCGGAAASAQEGSEGAEFFVRDVYGLRDDLPWSIDETRLDAVWSPRMAALIRRNRELANGELSYLDADPICSCQSSKSLTVQHIQIFSDRQRPDVVRMARVEFTHAGEPVTVLLALSGSPIDGWRIDDVIDHQGLPSLAEALAAANAGEASTSRVTQSEVGQRPRSHETRSAR